MAEEKKKDSGSIIDTIIPAIGELLMPTETKKTTAKSTAKKTTAKKSTAKKTAKKTSTAKKTTTAKKTSTAKKTTTSKKTSSKTVEPKNFTVQVGKKKFTYADVVKAVNSAYKDKIKDIDISVKTDEGKAYYVINGDEVGSVKIW